MNGGLGTARAGEEEGVMGVSAGKPGSCSIKKLLPAILLAVAYVLAENH